MNADQPNPDDLAPPGDRPPVEKLTWADLKPGDRVHHFEYGAGTFRFGGPMWVYIYWDDPKFRRLNGGYKSGHTAGIVQRLTRLPSPGLPGDASTGSN